MSLDHEQEKAAQEEAEARRVEEEDIRWLLASKQGRRFAWRILEIAGVYRTSFNNSGCITAFNEGKRNVGLMLLADILDIAPEQYLAMLKDRKT